MFPSKSALNRLPRRFRKEAVLVAFLLIGWTLRVWDWNAFPYHPDEALYGYWARLIASGKDPWLFSVYVDKPPLFIYALAGAFKLLGVSEASARVLNVFASFALLPVLWALFRRWFGDAVALAAVVVNHTAAVDLAVLVEQVVLHKSQI